MTTANTLHVWLPKRQHYAHFVPRDRLKRRAPINQFRFPQARP